MINGVVRLTVAVVLCGLGAGPASAQAPDDAGVSSSEGGITWMLTRVDEIDHIDPGNTIDSFDARESPALNKQECDSNVSLHLDLTNIPVGYRNLEVWAGVDCQDAARATRIGSEPPCTYVMNEEQAVDVTSHSDFLVPAKALCEQGDGQRSIFILPVQTLMASDAVDTYAQVTLTVDTVAPDPPTDLAVATKENGTLTEISWTAPRDAVSYWTILDNQALAVRGHDGAAGNSGAWETDASGSPHSESSACSSSKLEPGVGYDFDLVNLPEGLFSQWVLGRRGSSVFSAEELGNHEGAVGVMSVDSAGNHSVMSSLACIEPIEPASPRSHSSCAARPPGPLADGAGILPFGIGLLAFAGWYRRKRA